MSLEGSRALAGKCVVVTRPAHRARALIDALEAKGARVVLAPAIRIDPPDDPRPLDEALGRLGDYDVVAFTSANAVDVFFDRFAELYPGTPFPPLRLAAVGSKTAESLRERGHEPDVIPERFTAESLGEALLLEGDVSGERFLLPRADIARDELPELLAARGARVDTVVAYRTVETTEAVLPALARIETGEVDFVTFTSASTVRSFLAALADRPLARGFAAASIGPVTSDALRELGIEPSVEAEVSTIDGLVDAIARHVEQS